MPPRLKQKNLAKIAIENLGRTDLTKGELVEMGGYSKAVQDHPAKVLESKGFKQALAEYGLTEELITTSLVSDIKAKPKKRFLELSLGAEILGMKKRDPEDQSKKTVVAIQVIVNGTNNTQSRTDTEAIVSP